MEIRQVYTNKKEYLPLLLLGDEQENMIDRYLVQGEMYIMFDDGEPVAVCVVALQVDGICEIKNLAVSPNRQQQGLGRQMIEFICRKYCGCCHTLLVGTGDSPLTIPFYERCGFREAYRVPDFFTDHYDHPIIEGGCQLADMVYLALVLK